MGKQEGTQIVSWLEPTPTKKINLHSPGIVIGTVPPIVVSALGGRGLISTRGGMWGRGTRY